MKYDIQFTSELNKNPFSGVFIALEGIDGSGKSSQVAALKNYFSAQNRRVLTVRWPQREEGLVAEITKQYLHGEKKLPRPAFQYLLSADYVIFSEGVIIPALERGDVVITDRCHFWSAVAYGLWDNSENYDVSMAESILVAHGVLTKAYRFIVPDITFLLDVSVPTAMKRLSAEKKKEVYEKEEVLKKISQGYDWLVKKFPEEFVVVDAEQLIENVTRQIIDHLKKKNI
jgi:dTMP kinase